jgi:hypothetical protein
MLVYYLINFDYSLYGLLKLECFEVRFETKSSQKLRQERLIAPRINLILTLNGVFCIR